MIGYYLPLVKDLMFLNKRPRGHNCHQIIRLYTNCLSEELIFAIQKPIIE